MTFNSVFFIFLWFPITFLIQLALPGKIKNIFLIFSSLFFYAWKEPIFVWLLIGLILFNFYFVKKMDQYNNRERKSLFGFILLCNLFIFIYFKYYKFILDSVFTVLPFNIAYETFKMPLGISFFMFSLLAYIIDVYKKRYPAEKDLISFALFVTFFPKLVMGPITKYDEFKPQVNRHPFELKLFNNGAKRFIIGLAQKCILANSMAALFASLNTNQNNMVTSWLLLFVYAFQLYFDFNGYIHMAIGISNMLGFTLPENFQYPYLSPSIGIFWRRWHMTLGDWFKNYIYIPLGGNRVSKPKAIRNLLIVWILTGFWHGSSFVYMFWGLYHGLLIILERYVFKNIKDKLPLWLNILSTFILVIIGWTFFFSRDLNQVKNILGSLVNVSTFDFNLLVYYLKNHGMMLFICLIACTPVVKNIHINLSKKYNTQYIELFGMFLLFILSIACLIAQTYQSFLYFAF